MSVAEDPNNNNTNATITPIVSGNIGPEETLPDAGITPRQNKVPTTSGILTTTTSPSTYIAMAHSAMANLKDRNGSSIPTLLKFITNHFSDKVDGKKNIKFHLTNALKVMYFAYLPMLYYLYTCK